MFRTFAPYSGNRSAHGRKSVDRASTHLRPWLRSCVLEALESRRLLSVALNRATWTAVGPAPINAGQTPGSLSVSGRICAIAISPANPSQLYAATGGGGVWKSNDGGTSWSALTDSQSTLFTGAIAIAPSNPSVIYAGTGNPTVATYSYTGHGLLKSSDGGATWSLVGTSTFDRRAISQVVVSPTDANTVYASVSQPGANGAAGTTGVFKSTDGGATWSNTTASISTSESFTDVVIDPTNAQTLYCAVGTYVGAPANGVYKTINGGASWSLAGNFQSGIANGWIKLAISASSPQVVYASVAASGVIAEPTDFPIGTLYRMYRTSNGGSTWNTLSNTPDYLAGAGYFASALAVSPADPDVVYAAGFSGANSVIRSIDGGQSWTNIATGANGAGPHMLHHGLVVDASGKLYDADDGGAFKYDPSTSNWSSLNATLNVTELNSIALDPANPDVAFAGAQDNGTDKFSGSLTWSQKRQNNGGVARVDPTNGQTVYHEFSFGSNFFERSTDGGNTWSNKSSGISTSDDSNFYPPFVLDPSTPTRVLLGTNRVYQSTNGGSFSAISATNTNGWTTAEPIQAIAIAKTSSSTIYASAGGNIFVTTNGGSTWTARNPVSSPSADLDFSDILVDPTNASIAYTVAANYSDLTGGPHVWKTVNAGASWTNISANLPNAPVWSIALDPNGSVAAQDILYVGAETGVYRSINGGASWSVVGSGLPNAQVRDIEYNPTTQILAAGTYGRGMWEIQIVPPVVLSASYSDDLAQHTLTFRFSQNVSASLSSADLVVTNRVTGIVQNTQLLSYDSTTNTATFVFTDYPGETIPEGDYRAVLSGAGITNTDGNAIQSDTTLNFSHFVGDADHDRAVGTSDFVILASNFGNSSATFTQGDFNYDGVVNAIDFNVIATRFGTNFTPPPALPASATPVPDLFSTKPIDANETIF